MSAQLLCLPFPITDACLDSLGERVRTEGFEKVLLESIEIYKEKLKRDFEDQKYELMNQEFISNSESIYLTYYTDLILHFIDQENSSSSARTKVYVFLPEEILQFSQNKLNPFTREPLPDEIFEIAQQKKRSRSILQIWKRLLRRDIILN